jgi:hypothetical protein
MRTTFIGMGAFLGSIESECRCCVWADEPTDHGFDRSRLISIDLSLTPSRAAAGEIGWGDVRVDDCVLGSSGRPGGTTLGSYWPELQLVGALYMEEKAWRALPEPMRASSPAEGMPGRDYEFMSTVYWPDTDDPRASSRYLGHHAEILEEVGRLARVAIWPPGESLNPNVEPMALWIDLSSPDDCDAGPESLTTIGTGDAPKSGALFLPSGKLKGLEALR